MAMRMRVHPLGIVSLLACAALLRPAAAQPLPASSAPPPGAAFHTIADPKGRFTIDMPEGWRIVSLDAAIRQLAGSAASDVAPGTVVLSGLVGTSPGAPATIGATVFVTAIQLPPGHSPAGLVTRLRDSGWNNTAGAEKRGIRVIAAAPMTLDGRGAFYAYTAVTRPSTPDLYQVLVFFPGSDALILIGGMTVNEPGRVRTDIPLIVRIINTFRPTD